MRIYLEEKIGNPDLFTGRKKEITHFLNWINGIKQKSSKSTAILSRRKTGKSALLQRLYNLTFERNEGLVPFYFEIQETDQWIVSFSESFFLTFIYQYIAFKTRKPIYILGVPKSFNRAIEIAKAEKLDYLVDIIADVQTKQQTEQVDLLWDIVRDAPRTVAAYHDERVVQFVDEFQFINRFIFWDKHKKNRADNLAGSYLHTAEYRNAPMLISGSWVGWLMSDLISMLPGRFKPYYMEDIPQNEAIEMIYRYSLLVGVPVTEETAYLMANITEGSPFYISSLFHSMYSDKDFTTEEGVLKTLEFETLYRAGEIRGTWLEYINSAFPRINEQYAKDIVLYLSKHRDRFVPRRELKEALGLDMPDYQLDKKMDALLLSDIIEEERFQYRGVQDNIFDKVFRGRYGHDIDQFVTEGARNEYKALFEALKEKYKSLSGERNRYKGAFAEFMVIQRLRLEAHQDQALYHSIFYNLPSNFEFVLYQTVLPYHTFPLHEPQFQIDVFARAKPSQVSLIGEVKHRQAKFSLKEAQEFQKKATELIRLEQVEQAILFVFSSAGFHGNTLDFLQENGIAWSDDAHWLESSVVLPA
ncbi:hypothetical protein QUF58_06025 [Anaerolineales bacterium HSG24]|nr:hypothetical protein [Anaerolineales bacterium HSG24]